MSDTRIDISHIPFSRYGAYVSVCKIPGRPELDIHDCRQRFGNDLAFRMFFTDGDADLKSIDPKDQTISGLPIEVEASPSRVRVTSEKGSAEIVLTGDYTLSVTVKGMNLLMLAHTAYGYGIVSRENRKYEFLFHDEYRFGTVTLKKGFVRAEGPFMNDDTKAGSFAFDLKQNALITAENGEIDMDVHVAMTEARVDPPVDKEDAAAATEKEWEDFLSRMPEVPAAHRAFAEVSWYNLWSCFVHAQGEYETDAMLMSKKVMSSLWSWDHCFNAIAMIRVDPKAALEQFFLPFLHQSPSGVLPDMFNPNMGCAWVTTKPPIHGWAFSILMDRCKIGEETLRRAYTCLEKETDYWFTYRDEDGDGIPEYPMGCDSGWDNASVFMTKGRFIETPDLSAFLVLQEKCLARIAKELGDEKAAGEWTRKSEVLLQNLILHFWNGSEFVPKTNGTHEEIAETGCLLNYMPVVLGDLLPKDIADKTVKAMLDNNLTEWGLATEAPKSAYYESDGYWLGPIWAPPTYLIIDGLRRMGRTAEAKDLARRFTDLCAFRAEGNFENFDALTGTGLRAPGYTWTTSVYMELLWNYLQ